MNTFKKFGLIAVTLSSVVLLQACENEGPLEEAGAELDRAAANAADTTEDAVTDAGNAIEDACENISNSNC